MSTAVTTRLLHIYNLVKLGLNLPNYTTLNTTTMYIFTTNILVGLFYHHKHVITAVKGTSFLEFNWKEYNPIAGKEEPKKTKKEQI